MQSKSTEKKVNSTIRIPSELNRKLLERADEIGVSKQAFILWVLYRELTENQNRITTDDKQDS